MNAPAAGPDWDLTPYFSALDAPDYRDFRDLLVSDVARLRQRIEALAPPAGADPAWVEALVALEEASARHGHLGSFLSCVTAADAGDEVGQREEAAMARLAAEVEKTWVAVRAAFAAAGDLAFDALVSDARLEGARHFLRRVRARAARAMPPALEGLGADLAVDGISAWGRLYDRVSGNLTFTLEAPGQEPEVLPVSMTRTLLEDADPAVRDATRRGAAVAWEGVADTVAACLNAIAGTRLTLQRRRGIDDFLEPALFDAAIERSTLDAMLDAVRRRQDLPRRYLRRKAALLGKTRLGFHDLMAPLPRADGARIPWEVGGRRIRDAFAATYPALADFTGQALERRWVDHTPRPGKRPGGFCTSSHLIGESRVFMTYSGAAGDVQTLAHELGHAFHNWLMRDMRTWSRRYPMTLAETASTFAEQLVIDAALESPETTDADRLHLLDARLQDAETFLLNIPTRFDFEHAFYRRRAAGELSARELCDLMLEAQRENYGDALDPEALDRWFWASKLHFYITGVSFYNFPYTFGYLFSMGLFARAKAEGSAFLPRYERLLRQTASAPAEEVASDCLGVDLQDAGFWNASIDLIERDLTRYESLAGA